MLKMKMKIIKKLLFSAAWSFAIVASAVSIVYFIVLVAIKATIGQAAAIFVVIVFTALTLMIYLDKSKIDNDA